MTTDNRPESKANEAQRSEPEKDMKEEMFEKIKKELDFAECEPAVTFTIHQTQYLVDLVEEERARSLRLVNVLTDHWTGLSFPVRQALQAYKGETEGACYTCNRGRACTVHPTEAEKEGGNNG